MNETPALHFTHQAANRVQTLLVEEEDSVQNLRVYITGGGCAGFSYGFEFDEIINDDDTVVETKGVKLLVDALSIQYLMGSTIDYVEGLEGARFTVANPNASTTCGCGNSFSV